MEFVNARNEWKMQIKPATKTNNLIYIIILFQGRVKQIMGGGVKKILNGPGPKGRKVAKHITLLWDHCRYVGDRAVKS